MDRNHTYYLYILKNLEHKFYIGQTNNLEDRIQRHNKNMCRYTKNKGPWELVFTEVYQTRSEAMKRENN